MSWHYLRELGGESLEDICSGGEQCVQLKSKITHAVFYCNGKLMDSYLDSLSGTMLEPLTENLGKEKSMLSAVDSHARTSVLRGGGGGLDGKRSGLWSEMARIICEVRPKYAFIENSPMLAIRGLDRVLCDFASMGFDARWGVLGADDIGANHERKRIWIVAKISNSKRIGRNKGNNAQLGSNKAIRPSSSIPFKSSIEGFNRNNWKTEPNICRMVNGMADAMDRLKAIGNGQVPLVAATAWKLLSK